MTTHLQRPVKAETAEVFGPPTQDAICRLLASVELFARLDHQTLRRLAAGCTWIEVAAGAHVVTQGELGDKFYAILKGRLRALQQVEGAEVFLRQMQRGDWFGEVALLESAPRTASVVADEPSLLIVLSRDAFAEVVRQSPHVQNELMESAARRQSWGSKRKQPPAAAELLSRLASVLKVEDPQILSALQKELTWVGVPAGTILFKEGDHGDALYLVLAGQLEIVTHRQDGSRVQRAQVGAGEIIGEMALLTGAPRRATVSALADSELVRLTKEGYEAVARTQPETVAGLSRILASRLEASLRAQLVATQLSGMPIPSAADIQEIVSIPDLVLRNLKISQTYFQLSLQMAGLLGQQDANWCTFATHASKTAGYSIRKEELPGYGLVLWLEDHVDLLAGIERLPGRAFDVLSRYSSLPARLDAITQHISNCISAGNLKVFAEVAPVFAAFLRQFQRAVHADRDALRGVLASLEPGDSTMGGQQLLAEALTHYHDAMFDADAKRKAELILLANCKIGLHEQTRLQPYIVEALDTPVGDALDGAAKLLGGWLPGFASARADRVRRALQPRSAHSFRVFATRMMMRLRLPYGELSLGRDLPRLPSRAVYPDVLRALDLPELLALVSRFDRTRGALRSSRALDWGSLEDRMNFIVNLFRSRQQSYELFSQPFLYEQRRQMSSGEVPRGRL